MIPLHIAYFTSFGTMTLMILVTFFFTAQFLRKEAEGGQSNFAKMVTEKATAENQTASYSRVAGVLGAMALTTMFINVAYWVHYALFFGGALENLAKLWPAFALGSALFAPYAFNRISQLRPAKT